MHDFISPSIPAIPDAIFVDADDTLLAWTQEMQYRLAGHRNIAHITTHFDYSLFGQNVTADDVAMVMESEDFWYSLPVTELGERLMASLAQLPQDVMIVTSIPPRIMGRASRRAAAIAKVMLEDRFALPVAVLADGRLTRWHEMKAILAGPRKLLIDDSPSNAKAFAEAGGQAILVPQPWNTATGDPVSMLEFMCEPIEGVDIPLPRRFEQAAMHGVL